jgi:CRISPR-associated endonuclease Csn1
MEAKTRLVKKGIRDFALPWKLFTKEAKEKLEQTIVTFKSYNKVIDKPKNLYSKWILKEGKWIKEDKVKQVSNPKWMAVRQSLFAEQPHGKVYIKEVIEKNFETPKQMLNVMKLQIERTKTQNTPLQKTASYIYDKEARELVKRMIAEIHGSEEEILKQLKKYKPKDFKGEPITRIGIAVFSPYAAKRKAINKDFDHKVIDKIPYAEKSKIPQALHSHLLEYEQKKLGIEKLAWRNDRLEQLVNDVKYEPVDIKKEENKKLIKEAQSEAFSDEGLEILDKKVGIKIRKVTLMEDVGIKIPLKNKYSEADGNPYFIMYENTETKERSGYKSLSSYEVIQKKKKGEPIVEEREGFKTILLQSNDLVYVPTTEELEIIKKGISEKEAIDWTNQKKISERIYRVNNFSEYDIFFKPASFAKAIKSKELYTSFDDKSPRLIVYPKKDKDGNDITEEPIMIKEVCIKLKVDRLGKIIEVDGEKTQSNSL